jgi:hypothetical protein
MRSITLALLTVTIVCVASAHALVEYGPELIENGSFEADADEDGVPDGWRRNILLNGAAG